MSLRLSYLLADVREQLEEQLCQHSLGLTCGLVAAEQGVVDVSSLVHDKLALRHKPTILCDPV